MAVLANIYQIFWYGLCNEEGTEECDTCEDIRIEKLLNDNPQLRDTITSIATVALQGESFSFYTKIFSPEDYATRKTQLESVLGTSIEYIDDIIPPPVKYFKCGVPYIIGCSKDIESVEGGIKLVGFGSRPTTRYPEPDYGLITTDCDSQATTQFSELAKRYQICWFGTCSTDCENIRIEEVLNSTPELRDKVESLATVNELGREHAFYTKVFSTEAYLARKAQLESILGTTIDWIDDYIPPHVKYFKCGYPYVIGLDGVSSANPIVIDNVVTNNDSARISKMCEPCCTSDPPEILLPTTRCLPDGDMSFTFEVPDCVECDVTLLITPNDSSIPPNEICEWDWASSWCNLENREFTPNQSNTPENWTVVGDLDTEYLNQNKIKCTTDVAQLTQSIHLPPEQPFVLTIDSEGPCMCHF